MIVTNSFCLAVAVATLAIKVEGFQSFLPSIVFSSHHQYYHGPCSSSFPKAQAAAASLSFSASSATNAVDAIEAGGAEAEDDQIATSDIRLLFALLADTSILHDPSRGTCCRNQCSGCTYLDPTNGNFVYDEYTADTDDDGQRGGGWLAPYVKVDFGERLHASRWSEVLLPRIRIDDGDDSNPRPKEVERDRFAPLLGEPGVSPLALQSLWNVLSPAAGYPRLTPTEISRAIRGTEGSAYEMGGAVGYGAFEASMRGAADQIVRSGGVGGAGNDDTPDYDAMTKEELLEVVGERDMRTNFPKMKRFIIEELRFFDAHGRQGKRHPVKNTLS